MAGKKGRSSGKVRKLVRQLHLWFGLITGIIVFIVAITGCLWVFQEEITALTDDLPLIENKDQPLITPLEARKIAEGELPGRHIHGTLYQAEAAPVEVVFYEADPEFYQSVFLHPYTGEVLKVENHMSGFFHFILEGHMHLWLPENIGSEVVAWSTVIFVLMFISGIILWWPKSRKARKQRFTFDWKKTTKWKRKNYDLHSVTGFYVSIFGLIFAITGLIMTFDTVEEVIYSSLGGEKEVKFTIPDNSTAGSDTGPINRLIPKLMKQYPDAVDFEVHYPYTESKSIYVEIAYQDGVYYSSDYRFYDQYTLEEVATPSIYGVYADAVFPDKVIRMNYDIHVGAIGGIAGKIIAFLASLACAGLPVTGFLIWYGRKVKKPVKRYHSGKLVLGS